MDLRTRLSRARRGEPTPPRQAGDDWLSKLVRAFVGVLTELVKLVREMLAIPAELWLLAAETVGGAVLAVWLRAVVPAVRAGAALVAGAYEAARRHLTPARGLAAVAAAALVALIAAQWLDLSSISVGNDAYAPGVQSVAPAPEVSTERVGEAHAWVMVPLALAGLGLLAAALSGRPAASRLLIVLGIAAIAIALAIDAPKGLDEGTAAIAYEGVEAQLLEGFWLQIACGAVLIAAGLLLPLHLRAGGARASARSRRVPAPANRSGEVAL